MSPFVPRRLRFWQRCTALAGVALALVLGLLAVHPDWHAGLHGHEDASPAPHEEGSGCAVELFAAGVETPVDAPTAPPVERRVTEILQAAPSVDVAAPEYRLLPSQAPPVG